MLEFYILPEKYYIKIQCVCLAAGQRTQAGDATGAINENQLSSMKYKGVQKLCQVLGHPVGRNTCRM